MKIVNVLVCCVLVLPLMGADGGCGMGTDYEPPGAVTPGSKCSPQTCQSGCCLGDMCYSGASADACGSVGTQCSTCQSLQTCREQDPMRGRECLADQWLIQPEVAWIPFLDPSDGSAWDADESDPDVVVELSCPRGGSTITVRTSEVSSHNPKWSDGPCVAKAEELLKSPMSIRVIDVDAFFDDPIFSGSYAFKASDIGNGWVEIAIAVDGGSKLRLRLSSVQ